MPGWTWSRRRSAKHTGVPPPPPATTSSETQQYASSQAGPAQTPVANSDAATSSKPRAIFDFDEAAAPSTVAGSSVPSKPEGGAPVSSAPAEQGKPASTEAPTPPRPPLPPPKLSLHIDQILTWLVVAMLVVMVLMVKLVNPSLLLLLVACMVGAAVGLGFSWLFAYNRKQKTELQQVLSFDPGMKGLQSMLGELPTWVSFTRKEKMEWFNNILHEAWPHYDKAICEQIVDAVEPTLDAAKPSFIRRIFFKRFTFGEAPFRIEGIWVNQGTEELVIEVDVRWSGEANITLAIEMATEASKMCPKVKDISFVGNLRIRLKPLLDKIPIAGVAMVSFVKPPIIKFDLDFGAGLGGGFLPRQIMGFVDGIIQTTVSDMLVWPNRLVIPIGPDMEEEVTRQELQDVGVMRIVVISAKGLRAEDVGGTSDPIAELSINSKRTVETKCIKKNLEPVWNETFHLLVQEPQDQYLRVVVSDVDMFNAKDINLLKGNVGIGSRTMLGRAQIQIRDITAREGQDVDLMSYLGRGEWGDDGGPGKGEGQIFMKCCFKSFSNINELDVSRAEGILQVSIFKVVRLEAPSGGKSLKVNIIVKVDKTEIFSDRTIEVKPVKNEYGENEYSYKFTSPLRFSFPDIKIGSDIKIKVRQAGTLTGGLAETIARSTQLTVGDVAESRSKGQPGLLVDRITLEESLSDSYVEAELRYVPKF